LILAGLLLAWAAGLAVPDVLGKGLFFDGKRAFRDLEKQVAFGPRPPGSPAHESLLRYLVAYFEPLAEQVRLQPFTHPGRGGESEIRLNNVIVEFRPELPRRVMLAAHWDTRPFADEDPDPANRSLPIPGANDGASGVAVLMELARCLASDPPPVGVDLVLFDGEDWGESGHLEDYFLGSRYFAAHLGGYRPEFALVLDMIGDKDLSIYREVYSDRSARWLVDMVWNKARELGLSAFIDAPGLAIQDDHLPLIEAGLAAIVIIDFDYPYWHTVHDTPDKCSPASLEAVGKLVLAVIGEL